MQTPPQMQEDPINLSVLDPTWSYYNIILWKLFWTMYEKGTKTVVKPLAKRVQNKSALIIIQTFAISQINIYSFMVLFIFSLSWTL